MNSIKIVIADDHKGLADMMKNFIEKNSKYRVIDIATSSAEQLEIMGKHNPDVIITDIMRKGESISGLDIVRVCEKQDKKVKFILVTASTKQEFVKENGEMPKNVIGYLKKPFEWNEIIEELQKAELVIGNCSGGLEQSYYILPIIDLDKELTAEEKTILQQLDIRIKEKEYTQHEYDIVKQKLLFYYNPDEDIEESKEYKQNLSDKIITIDEYKKLWNKLDYLDEKYIYKK